MYKLCSLALDIDCSLALDTEADSGSKRSIHSLKDLHLSSGVQDLINITLVRIFRSLSHSETPSVMARYTPHYEKYNDNDIRLFIKAMIWHSKNDCLTFSQTKNEYLVTHPKNVCGNFRAHLLPMLILDLFVLGIQAALLTKDIFYGQTFRNHIQSQLPNSPALVKAVMISSNIALNVFTLWSLNPFEYSAPKHQYRLKTCGEFWSFFCPNKQSETPKITIRTSRWTREGSLRSHSVDPASSCWMRFISYFAENRIFHYPHEDHINTTGRLASIPINLINGPRHIWDAIMTATGAECFTHYLHHHGRQAEFMTAYVNTFVKYISSIATLSDHYERLPLYFHNAEYAVMSTFSGNTTNGTSSNITDANGDPVTRNESIADTLFIAYFITAIVCWLFPFIFDSLQHLYRRLFYVKIDDTRLNKEDLTPLAGALPTEPNTPIYIDAEVHAKAAEKKRINALVTSTQRAFDEISKDPKQCWDLSKKIIQNNVPFSDFVLWRGSVTDALNDLIKKIDRIIKQDELSRQETRVVLEALFMLASGLKYEESSSCQCNSLFERLNAFTCSIFAKCCPRPDAEDRLQYLPDPRAILERIQQGESMDAIYRDEIASAKRRAALDGRHTEEFDIELQLDDPKPLTAASGDHTQGRAQGPEQIERPDHSELGEGHTHHNNSRGVRNKKKATLSI